MTELSPQLVGLQIRLLALIGLVDCARSGHLARDRADVFERSVGLVSEGEMFDIDAVQSLDFLISGYTES